MGEEYEIDIAALAEEYQRLKPRFTLDMPFGKYRGVGIADTYPSGKPKIPSGYLRVVLRFDNLDVALKASIEAELSRRQPPGEPLEGERLTA